MALQFMDGFDAYSYANSVNEDFFTIWNVFGSQNVQQRTGRYSGYSVYPSAYSSPCQCLRSVVSETTMILGLAFSAGVGGPAYFGFCDSAGNGIAFVSFISSAGTLYLGGSADGMPSGGTLVNSTTFTGNPVASSWAYYELEIVQGTTGAVNLRMNGAQIASLSGNTAISGVGALSAVFIGENGSTGQNYFYDDLYVLDGTGSINNTFLAPAGGDVRVATFFPTGAGADTQLTPTGASANWQCVSEQSPDFDSTYVSSATAGQEDLYAFTPALPTTNQIFGVGVKTLARKDDSNTRSIASLLSSGATVAQGATNALGSSYVAYNDTYNTDPNTSAAWTVSAVNALQAGVKVIS